MICTVAEVGHNHSACGGDSGGPLVHDNVVVGVVSWGITPCGTEDAPTVAISACIHRDFVLRSSATRMFLNYIKFRFNLSTIFVIFVYLRKLQW